LIDCLEGLAIRAALIFIEGTLPGVEKCARLTLRELLLDAPALDRPQKRHALDLMLR